MTTPVLARAGRALGRLVLGPAGTGRLLLWVQAGLLAYALAAPYGLVPAAVLACAGLCLWALAAARVLAITARPLGAVYGSFLATALACITITWFGGVYGQILHAGGGYGPGQPAGGALAGLPPGALAGRALHFSAGVFFTIGFGDLVPLTPPMRLAALAEAIVSYWLGIVLVGRLAWRARRPP